MLPVRIALVALVACGAPALEAPRPVPTLGEVRVPFDHAAPAEGTFALRYELGAPFDPDLPTILLVADGQQYWVRPGAAATLQDQLVGPGFNVVAVVPRHQTDEVLARVSDPVDWPAAYRLFASAQYIADLEAVRRRVVGADDRVILYGRSGGAYLVHEYLARHCEHVARAFTQATLNPFVQAELGLDSDRFWEELAPADRERLATVLARHPDRRLAIARTFQRQNFFEPDIATARAALIDRLLAEDWDHVAERQRAYQVDAIDQLLTTPAGVAARVRLFEMHQPVARAPSSALAPDTENSAAIAAPLLDALAAGTIAPPRMDLGALGRCDTEVLLLAGARDHTADVRTQAPLAARYPHARVVVLDDDHVFARLAESGLARDLVSAFARAGLTGAPLARTLERLAPLVTQAPRRP